jgi:hypothetical protein
VKDTETWFAVLDDTGALVSTGTVIDGDAIAAKGWTVKRRDVPKGKVPKWVSGDLVAADPPPPPPPAESLEDMVRRIVAEALAKRAKP